MNFIKDYQQQKVPMQDTENFIKAYHEFRESVDFEKSGILPELDDLVWCMLMGIPPVPADKDSSYEAQVTAIDQRINILKAVFIEVNKDQPEAFLDQGLTRYDQAGKMAKLLLKEQKAESSRNEA
jgi:hypothetical protein